MITETEARELAYRAGDGVEVSLLWHPAGNTLSLCVVYGWTGESFTLDVDPAEALEAFYHPFAYAAFRGVEFAEPRREEYEALAG